MANSAQAFQTAFGHHQAGRLREAEQLYRQVLASEPNHADALHLLGLVAHQVGRHEAAADLIGRAVAQRGDQAAMHANLGEVYRVLGRAFDAEQSLRRALAMDSKQPDAHNSLGNVLRSSGLMDEAAGEYREAIRLRPAFPDAHNNLATVLQHQQNLPAAIEHYRQAIALRPNYLVACQNLCTALRDQGQRSEAIEIGKRAVALAPDNEEVQKNLAAMYVEEKQWDDAAASYREILRINPNSALALFQLGAIAREQGNLDEAIASNMRAFELQPEQIEVLWKLDWLLFAAGRHEDAISLYNFALTRHPNVALAYARRGHYLRLQARAREAIVDCKKAIELDPSLAEAYNTLAIVYLKMSRPEDALQNCQKGLQYDPDSGPLLTNLATALQMQGRISEAVATSRKAVGLGAEMAAAHNNLLYMLNADPTCDDATIFAEHCEWARLYAEPITAAAPPPPARDQSPQRRLKIGYMSPYFRDHAVNHFTEPMLASHDHERFEIFCYDHTPIRDPINQRLRPLADHWRDVPHHSDDKLAQAVRDDGIDILVDLTGHIGDNRLRMFARKPAPIQVTYLGYQNTTGMTAMDYRLTDAQADPPGLTDRYYTERLVRLPRAFFCYQPPAEAPEIKPLPALASGRITFGAFNNFMKTTPHVLDAWMSILARVENSRLLVLAYREGYLRDHFTELARARGIDPDRIELFDKRPRADYFRLFEQADISLEPFPFTGHTTTCDSVWIGVPALQLRGNSYVSRFGGSVLTNVGLDDMITDSVEEYIKRAVALAGDLDTLARLRKELRPRMAASPLLDYVGFTRHVEDAYREMWIRWCQEQA